MPAVQSQSGRRTASVAKTRKNIHLDVKHWRRRRMGSTLPKPFCERRFTARHEWQLDESNGGADLKLPRRYYNDLRSTHNHRRTFRDACPSAPLGLQSQLRPFGWSLSTQLK